MSNILGANAKQKLKRNPLTKTKDRILIKPIKTKHTQIARMDKITSRPNPLIFRDLKVITNHVRTTKVAIPQTATSKELDNKGALTVRSTIALLDKTKY
jgi:hypothetical protein